MFRNQCFDPLSQRVMSLPNVCLCVIEWEQVGAPLTRRAPSLTADLVLDMLLKQCNLMHLTLDNNSNNASSSSASASSSSSSTSTSSPELARRVSMSSSSSSGSQQQEQDEADESSQGAVGGGGNGGNGVCPVTKEGVLVKAVKVIDRRCGRWRWW
jgi:hypothetical protein